MKMRRFFSLSNILLVMGTLLLLASRWLSLTMPVKYKRLKPAPWMTEAGLYVHCPLGLKPQGILVLANGYNSTEGYLAYNREWQRFAEAHQLALVEIAFASELDELHPKGGRGYYYPQFGSGALLLDALDKRFGGGLPLWCFGFSGGGHFVSRFQAWAPERVAAWAVCGVGWWDEPRQGDFPPGIVICGEEDERFFRCRESFEKRYALGHRILWMAVPQSGHEIAPSSAAFVKVYFHALLTATGTVEWTEGRTGDGWLPADDKLLEEYRQVEVLLLRDGGGIDSVRRRAVDLPGIGQI